jgi:hypothetical protein
MPVLKNPKHERFAQEVASGKTQVEAYEIAGYKPNDGNAAQLAKRPEISARVAEINGIAADKVAIDKSWVLERLITNSERAMQVIEVLDKDGNGTGEFRYEGNVANKALELIGKELGMFKERLELSGNVALGDRLDKAIGRK